MSEQGEGSTQKASEILRRRGDRASKLQRTIDRGSQRSLVEDSPEDTSVKEEQQGRPAKPIRITVDVNASQHRFLREYCLNTGTKGTAVLRGLLAELADDEELRQRLTQRLKR